MDTVRLRYRLTLRDSKGRMVKRTRWRRSHSFVVAFLKHLRAAFVDSNEAGTIDTSGASKSLNSPSPYTYPFLEVVNTTADQYGVVVGAGATAVSPGDYALESIIHNGTGVGQLDYGQTSVGNVAAGGGKTSMTLTRSFANSSGGDITVNEIGIYVFSYGAGISAYFCIARDVLASGQNVPNGQTLTIDYTLEFAQ